ncbi:MAG TPA: YtxH domain-containing protein [Chloroflexi bacterium]|nr:YtxH domain-containing protein [Chloroflexota bacterium]
MGRRSAFVIGLIVGAIVGWVLAMFTMPHTGQEMREALGERAVELRERAEAMAARARHEADEVARDVAEKVTD